MLDNVCILKIMIMSCYKCLIQFISLCIKNSYINFTYCSVAKPSLGPFNSQAQLLRLAPLHSLRKFIS